MLAIHAVIVGTSLFEPFCGSSFHALIYRLAPSLPAAVRSCCGTNQWSLLVESFERQPTPHGPWAEPPASALPGAPRPTGPERPAAPYHDPCRRFDGSMEPHRHPRRSSSRRAEVGWSEAPE